ncbi:MAG: helix-turn-helix domain-containing protein [Chloroflexi bacterium]|nr:helix-turn-helix domain-containing protein [Chloroflexota bacterium]
MNKAPHTRIFDELIPEFGLVGAAVYGVVWRYCQMRDGSCHATHETLSNELGIGQSTVRRYINELRDAQYIAVIFDKANSPNWMILAENQLSGDSTSKEEGASR